MGHKASDQMHFFCISSLPGKHRGPLGYPGTFAGVLADCCGLGFFSQGRSET